MAQAITDATLSKEWLKFSPDEIWAAQALPNATDLTSDLFMAGNDQGGVGIQIEADTTVDIDSTATLDVFLITYDTSGGAEVSTIPLLANDNSTQKTYAIGEQIVAYIPEDTGPWNRLKITSSDDESDDDINAYLRYLSR